MPDNNKFNELILTDKIKEKAKSLLEDATNLMKAVKEKDEELNRLKSENKELKEKIKSSGRYD